MKKSLALILAAMLALSLVPAMAEEAQPTYGGSLSVLGFDFNTFFLPHSTTTSDRYNAAPAIEALGRRNPETGDTEGWLADEMIVDAEALTLTLKLHQGIKFSDGTDFNADAVVWNFQQMVDFGKASELVNPTSFEKTDDYTVVLHYANWANTWADTVGEVRIYSPAAYEANGEDWAAINPVGTGAFVMKEMVADSHITYVKNDNYWREGEPYLDEIVVKFISDSTTKLSSFMNGELDVLRNPDSVAIKQLQNQYQNVANSAPDLAGITYIMFCSGVEESPFYNLDVRLAVMHAIDWDEMADAIYDGLGGATPVFAVPGAWSYDNDLPLYTKDIDLAKSLLAGAGYPNGFDTVITLNSENPANEPCAVMLQYYLSEIGINAEIKKLTNADFNAQKAEGNYDLGIMVNNGASKLDFTANYIRLYSSEGVNYKVMMAKPSDYEDALFGARAAKTLEEKKELLKTAARLFSHDYALVVATGYQGAYCYAQAGVHNTGICSTTAEAWTPESAWKEAK
ncbi:MAG: ABC transporter substrate-binding protein [Clostridia bacterium]|nr:ABC transporter substrate-binding protein [Clostridia bacterium]